MARTFAYAQRWLEHDGKRVVVDGIAYTLRVQQFTAGYIVAQQMITVFADPCNKRSKAYRVIREQLGDDWSTDVLESDVETEVAFFQAAQRARMREA